MRRHVLARLKDDRGGATAMEFAFVLPIFILLTLGALSAAIYGYSLVSLQFAVQDAARCAAVRPGVCSDLTSISAYAQSKYLGVDLKPTYYYSTSPCAHTLRVTGTFALNVIPAMMNVPMSARACYG
jgi:Flp pilus assembly protein TadG